MQFFNAVFPKFNDYITFIDVFSKILIMQLIHETMLIKY